jgi:hypothetical protein
MLNQGEMTAEELEAVRKYHDEMVEKARLELRVESVRDARPQARPQMPPPIGMQLQELAAVAEMH